MLEQDLWWQFSGAVKDLNSQWHKVIISLVWKTLGDSMSMYKPRKTKTDGLPNISYILPNPEPLGKYIYFFYFVVFCTLLTMNLVLLFIFLQVLNSSAFVDPVLGCMLALKI